MATSKDSTNQAGSGDENAHSGQEVLSRRRGTPLLMRLAVLSGFFALAALGSWHLQGPSVEEEEDETTAPAKFKNPARTALPASSHVELLTRADQALRQFRFAVALPLYEELRAASPTHGPLIDYRLALCNESIGQVDKAIARYRTAVSGAVPPALSFACHLGQSRCLFRQGHFAEARRLLYPVLLDESRQRDLPRAFVADARYLLALALSREAMAPLAAKNANDSPVSVSSIGLGIPDYLDELGAPATPPPQVASEKPAQTTAETKTADSKRNDVTKKPDTRTAVVRKVDVDRPAPEVLDLLAAKSGVPIKLSAEASKKVANRFLQLCFQTWQLDDLLDLVADHFDMLCRVDGTTRHICEPSEIDANQLAILQRDRSMRALRGVLLTDAAHPWTAAACLEMGNWEAVQGRLPEAASWFDRLVREVPNSPYVPAAYFNLALVHFDRHDAAAARAAFFRVADHSPGHDLALKAHVRIGISHLEDEEFKEAILHLRHAQATAPQSEQHAHVTVALAAAYLLNKQLDLARATLAKERSLLQKEPCKATAAFVDAYAQYLLAKEFSPARREASDLLSTLWRDQDKTVLGPLGDHMLAQAYRDLGFWGHAEQILRKTPPPASDVLAKAVEYALADTLMKQHQRDEATKLFEKLAATPSSYRPRARLQLAQIKLLDKQWKVCAETCRELWKERSNLDAQAVLQVWGSALDGMGEFTKAAQCYAGKPPEEESKK